MYVQDTREKINWLWEVLWAGYLKTQIKLHYYASVR